MNDTHTSPDWDAIFPILDSLASHLKPQSLAQEELDSLASLLKSQRLANLASLLKSQRLAKEELDSLASHLKSQRLAQEELPNKIVYKTQEELANKIVYKTQDGLVWVFQFGSVGSSFAAVGEDAAVIMIEERKPKES